MVSRFQRSRSSIGTAEGAFGAIMLTLAQLTQFLEDDLGVDTLALTPDTPLFSGGIIDSFALVTLLTFLESEGGIRINPMDVNLDNMDSLARMLAYVERARG